MTKISKYFSPMKHKMFSKEKALANNNLGPGPRRFMSKLKQSMPRSMHTHTHSCSEGMVPFSSVNFWPMKTIKSLQSTSACTLV